MNCFIKLRNYLRRKLYDEETGYYLNYLTLTISEPTIAKEAQVHLGNQFARVYWPLLLSILLNFCMHIYNIYFQKSGHPMNLVAGGGSLFILSIIFVLLRLKKMGPIQYFALPYMLHHAIVTVCVYKEWLPDAW